MNDLTASNCILEDNIDYIIRESRQKDMSDEKIISLYGDAIEKLNGYLMYHKFGLREGEIAVLRRGGLEKTKYEGFNFTSESGETTYAADLFDEDVKRYALKDRYVLNLADKNSELRKEFDKKLEELEKEIKNKELIKIIENVKMIIKKKDRENDIYTYIDIEENGFDVLAKELEFKGILYWEWGDVTKPSTYLIFDLSIVREISKYYALCKVR